MPPACCVGGCNKETVKDGVSHHGFPKDKKLRSLWIKSVANTRKDWTGPTESTKRNSIVVCSDHFREDCFTSTYRTKKSLGLPAKPQLESDAIPTIFNLPRLPVPGGSNAEEVTVPKKARSAVRKREVRRVSIINLKLVFLPIGHTGSIPHIHTLAIHDTHSLLPVYCLQNTVIWQVGEITVCSTTCCPKNMPI